MQSTITGDPSSVRLGAWGDELAGRVGRTVLAAAVPATIAVCLVRTWMMRLARAAWRRAACFLRPASMRALPAFLSAAGAVPAPRPRFVSVVRLAWWDGVSHVVTPPTRLDQPSSWGTRVNNGGPKEAAGSSVRNQQVR